MTLHQINLIAEPRLEIAADQLRRYPGELATVRVHWHVPPDKADVILQVAMPRSMVIETYSLPEGAPVIVPDISVTDEDLIFQIDLAKAPTKERDSELRLDIRVDDLKFDHYFHLDASLLTRDLATILSATTRVAVKADGKYLDHLPELYRSDELTSRLLMLIESFWSPIEEQIEQGEHYFDPALTPPAFLPWLSGWIGFPAQPDLPQERVRKLLRNAMALFQTRGTLGALRTFLEITTEGRVILIERRANNFVLGRGAYLGSGTALGKDNKPDTVTIDLTVPESELALTKTNRNQYHERVSASITEFIPANVFFDLRVHYTQA